MGGDSDHEFETTESGASHTFPQQAGEIRKGSHLMIKGRPCKCVEVSTSKTGKHGHAKAHIVALDIFTNKKYEDLCPASHNLDVPFVKKTEYQVLDASIGDGSVTLLNEDGSTKDDLSLPSHPQEVSVSPTDEDVKCAKELVAAVEKGEQTVIAIVQWACGREKIIGCKTTG